MRRTLAVIMSILGGLLGVVFSLYVFLNVYDLQIQAELSRGASVEALLVSYILPLLTVLAVVGGIAWIVAGCGFYTGQDWNFPTAIMACIISILAGFFPILPYVSSGLGFPPTSIIFTVNFLFFLLLQAYVRPTNIRSIVLSLLSGMAFILAFVNGVASTHYIFVTMDPLYISLQPLNFIASAGWAVTTVGVVLRMDWMKRLALGSGIASIVAGGPLAVVTQMELGRLSLFWPSPLLAAATLVVMYLVGKCSEDSRVALISTQP